MKIQTDYYTIIPYDNLLVISTFDSWDEKITAKHIEDVTDITSRFYQTRNWGLLSDRSNWQLSTPEAENLFSEKAKSALPSTLTHMAICVGESELKKWQISKMISEFANFEVKIFEAIGSAESWLASYGYLRQYSKRHE